jgi:hypothetical protein
MHGKNNQKWKVIEQNQINTLMVFLFQVNNVNPRDTPRISTTKDGVIRGSYNQFELAKTSTRQNHIGATK